MCIKMIYNHFYLKMYSSIKQQSSTEWNHNYFCTNPVLHQCSFLSFDNCTIVCSVQFSHSVMSSSFWPREPQHARPPCPSATARVHPNPCPSSQWCHPTMSSSVVPFFSCPQSFPASGPFQMSHLFASGGQSIGISASTSVLPMNTQDQSPLGWTGWISLQSKRTLKSLLQHHSSKPSILLRSAFFIVQVSHPYMTTGKTIAWPDGPLLAK